MDAAHAQPNGCAPAPDPRRNRRGPWLPRHAQTPILARRRPSFGGRCGSWPKAGRRRFERLLRDSCLRRGGTERSSPPAWSAATTGCCATGASDEALSPEKKPVPSRRLPSLSFFTTLVEYWRLSCRIGAPISSSAFILWQHIPARILRERNLAARVPLLCVVTDPGYGFWRGWACRRRDAIFRGRRRSAPPVG